MPTDAEPSALAAIAAFLLRGRLAGGMAFDTAMAITINHSQDETEPEEEDE